MDVVREWLQTHRTLRLVLSPSQETRRADVILFNGPPQSGKGSEITAFCLEHDDVAAVELVVTQDLTYEAVLSALVEAVSAAGADRIPFVFLRNAHNCPQLLVGEEAYLVRACARGTLEAHDAAPRTPLLVVGTIWDPTGIVHTAAAAHGGWRIVPAFAQLTADDVRHLLEIGTTFFRGVKGVDVSSVTDAEIAFLRKKTPGDIFKAVESAAAAAVLREMENPVVKISKTTYFTKNVLVVTREDWRAIGTPTSGTASAPS